MSEKEHEYQSIATNSTPLITAYTDLREEIVEQCKVKIPILREDSNKFIHNPQGALNFILEGDTYPSLVALAISGKKYNIIHIDIPHNNLTFGNSSIRTDTYFNNEYVKSTDNLAISKWGSSAKNILKVCRLLLAENGIILIHIGHKLLYTLGIICQNIFGLENLLTTIVWSNYSGGPDSKLFLNKEQHILCFAKDKNNVKMYKPSLTSRDVKEYKQTDEYEETRGKHKISRLDQYGTKPLKDGFYPIELKSGEILKPNENGWRVTQDELYKRNDNGFVVIKDHKIYLKQYVNVDEHGNPNERTLGVVSIIPKYTTGQATIELRKLFNGTQVFEYPLPVPLLEHLLSMFVEKDSSVLSIFANDGVVGHAILNMNNMDSGSRTFTLCSHNRRNVCTDVCYPRIRKVMCGYTTNNGDVVNGLGGSLRYYNISLEDADKTDINKFNIFKKSRDMICFREGCFSIVKETYEYVIFTNGIGKYIAISYDYKDDNIATLHEEIKKLNIEVDIFVFGFDYFKEDNIKSEPMHTLNNHYNIVK